MKNIKSHFKFNKQERSGIFFLLFLIVVLQVGYFVYRSLPSEPGQTLRFDSDTQAEVEALKQRAAVKDTFNIFPFNPNFITDFKGYSLGMSVKEIDRLHAFREQGKFANSSEDFQKVTQVSDSLLNSISPYFKFPEWTQKNSRLNSLGSNQDNIKRESHPTLEGLGEVLDLNSATVEDLKTIRGIGETLSARIVKFRDRLGGFLVNEQLYDVYGLEPQVVDRALQRFKVLKTPTIQKINLNTASVQDLQKLIYLQKKVAIGIVNYRNDNGSIDSLDELINIDDFPVDKIDRIALYLSLN